MRTRSNTNKKEILIPDSDTSHTRAHAWTPASAKIRKSHASTREAGSTTVRHRVARRALEQIEGSAHDALAQNDDEEYEIQTHKLSL